MLRLVGAFMRARRGDSAEGGRIHRCFEGHSLVMSHLRDLRARSPSAHRWAMFVSREAPLGESRASSAEVRGVRCAVCGVRCAVCGVRCAVRGVCCSQERS